MKAKCAFVALIFTFMSSSTANADTAFAVANRWCKKTTLGAPTYEALVESVSYHVRANKETGFEVWDPDWELPNFPNVVESWMKRLCPENYKRFLVENETKNHD